MTNTVASSRGRDDTRSLAAAAAEEPGFVFGSPLRRNVTILVALTVPLAAAASLLVHSQTAFLIAWPLAGMANGFSLRPLSIASQRTRSPHREFWRLWLYGSALAHLLGLALIVSALAPAVVNDSPALLLFGYALAGGAGFFWTAAVVWLLRAKSGRRTVVIDMLDWFIAFVAVSAPGLVVVVQRVVYSDAAWFAIPCAIAACVLTASILPSAVIYSRLPRGERVVEGIFVGVACASALNSWLLVAMALSNFSMNAAPVLAVQAADMGLMLLLPLYSSHKVTDGLNRLSAEAQVRRHGIDLTLVLAAVPVMVAETLLLPEAREWAVPLWVGVLGTLLCLVAVRYSLVLRETRRLYLDLQQLADERQHLLTSMMRAAEGDNHRVAAQLHEEAISTLVVLGSVARSARCDDDRGAGDGSLTRVRADLTARADALRQFMLAMRAPEVDQQSLVTSLRVCCVELFGDRAGPAVTIDVDADLVLDWTTRTIIHRIAREAIRNAWRQGGVSQLDIRVWWDERSVALDIAHDGRAGDAASTMQESGLEAMRLFARLGGGSLREHRADGRTHVVARLGDLGALDDRPVEPTPPRAGLRLVVDDRTLVGPRERIS